MINSEAINNALKSGEVQKGGVIAENHKVTNFVDVRVRY